MNIIDLIIIAILAFSLLAGMHKGALASLLTAVGFGGAWLGATRLYKRVAEFALSNTTLMAVLNQYLEPESFFTNFTEASTKVTDLLAKAGTNVETAIGDAVAKATERFPLIADTLKFNIRHENFKALNLTTVSDYFNQTLWVAVFNVLAFILTFLVLYWAITLVVNLLNHIIRFPLLRVCDALVGGLFGLIRGYIVVLLLISILPAITALIDPALAAQLEHGGVYTFVRDADLFVGRWIRTLVQG